MVLLFPALALGETMDDLMKRDGLFYKEFNPVKRWILLLIRQPGHNVVPFTGTVTGKTQGTIKNGKKDGPWVSYHDNGQLSSKGTYKDNKKYGPYVNYYDNGQLGSKGTYKDGKRDGPWVSYSSDGSEMVVED
jgi:antitoxin component YwqK of YwqJK toxin-antitoxin module